MFIVLNIVMVIQTFLATFVNRVFCKILLPSFPYLGKVGKNL